MRYDIPIDLYEKFGSDFYDLCEWAQTEVAELLKKLAVNPYDPAIQRKCSLHGERFAYPLSDGHSVIWRVEINEGSILKMRVLVSAIEKL
jgi:hypothetical protein